MVKIVIALSLLGTTYIVVPSASSGQSAYDIDRETYKDPERSRLQDRERQLLDAEDQLRKVDLDLDAKINALQKSKDDVEVGLRKVQHELNSIHLQLVQ